MPTFKNIRIKKRGGGTRLQRVQVLASGKYKFVKNKPSSRSSSTRKSRKPVKRRRRAYRSVKKVSRTGKSFFKNMSGVGVIEDAAIGYIGLNLFAGMGSAALPATRVVQGIAGHVLKRRGKGRLMYGLIDLIDLYLAGQFRLGNGFQSSGVANLIKLRPL